MLMPNKMKIPGGYQKGSSMARIRIAIAWSLVALAISHMTIAPQTGSLQNHRMSESENLPQADSILSRSHSYFVAPSQSPSSLPPSSLPPSASASLSSANTNVHLNPNFNFNVSRADRMMARVFNESPIVIPHYKLVFFTTPKIGCTVWKQLFRRMMGYRNWKSTVHNPAQNGLIYLSEYSLREAKHILQHWTKAIWVRDPKERFLSAYLQKAVASNGLHLKKCCKCQGPEAKSGTCLGRARASIGNFYDHIAANCPTEEHWRPQSQRIEAKYLSAFESLDQAGISDFFVGHIESKSTDAKRLLERLHPNLETIFPKPSILQRNKISLDGLVIGSKANAWEEYGLSGWGAEDEGANQTNTSASVMFGATGTIGHSTSADKKMREYYTPDVEDAVEAYYKDDYGMPVFGFQSVRVSDPSSAKRNSTSIAGAAAAVVA